MSMSRKLEEELLLVLRSRIEDVKDIMANGNASSFEEYHKLVGVIAGITYAIDALADVRRLLDEQYR